MNSRFLASLCLVGPLWAHDPVTTKLTWTQEISRIVGKRCVFCHSDFKSYETARPWAKAIRDEVASRRMPPWGAVSGVGEFLGDPSLSAVEREMLVAWVEGGAPEGNRAYLPSLIPPPKPVAALPRYRRAIVVQREFKLEQSGSVVALRPRATNDHASLEAWAVLPDGAVDRLIWVPDYRKSASRSYVVREPAVLPAGTRLRVEASPSAAITFYVR